jgi:hypothetical protein
MISSDEASGNILRIWIVRHAVLRAIGGNGSLTVSGDCVLSNFDSGGMALAVGPLFGVSLFFNAPTTVSAAFPADKPGTVTISIECDSVKLLLIGPIH